MKGFLERDFVQPGPAGLVQNGEMIGHEERLVGRMEIPRMGATE
jgi:hypothetical protein